MELLEKQDISRKEFSSQIGISYSSIHNGVLLSSIPSADVALKIANRLNTTVEYLVYGNNALDSNKSDKKASKKEEIFLYRKNKDIIDAINALPQDIRSSVKDLLVRIAKNI